MPDFTNALLAGFQTGRELRRQEGERAAMSDLVNGNPSALGQLATYNPQAAMQYKQQQDAEAARVEQQRQKMLTDGKKVVGQAALQVAQLPPEQRPAAWNSAIDYLVSQGWDGLAQFKNQYSEQSLMGVISEAGLANELRQAQQPRIVPVQPGGYVAEISPDGGARYIVAPDGQIPQPANNVPNGSPLQGNIPAGAIQFLQQHPELAAEFDAKYGAGLSRRILGGN